MLFEETREWFEFVVVLLWHFFLHRTTHTHVVAFHYPTGNQSKCILVLWNHGSDSRHGGQSSHSAGLQSTSTAIYPYSAPHHAFGCSEHGLPQLHPYITSVCDYMGSDGHSIRFGYYLHLAFSDSLDISHGDHVTLILPGVQPIEFHDHLLRSAHQLALLDLLPSSIQSCLTDNYVHDPERHAAPIICKHQCCATTWINELLLLQTYFEFLVVYTTLPILLLLVCGILTIKNIRTVKQASHHLERQMTRVVVLQTLVASVALLPYCVQIMQVLKGVDFFGV